MWWMREDQRKLHFLFCLSNLLQVKCRKIKIWEYVGVITKTFQNHLDGKGQMLKPFYIKGNLLLMIAAFIIFFMLPVFAWFACLFVCFGG